MGLTAWGDERSYLGYRRPDGRVGVRNLVLFVSQVDAVNWVAERAADVVRSAVPIGTWYGRGLFGRDRRARQRVVHGSIDNPNVYGAVVIDLEKKAAEETADNLRGSGKPVVAIGIEDDGGPILSLAAAVRAGGLLAIDASRERRASCPIESLVVAVKCGSSDGLSGPVSNRLVGVCVDLLTDSGATVIMSEPSEWVGAEQLLADRAIDEDTRRRILELARSYEDIVTEEGVSFVGIQPGSDNIRGGLSTIEDKAVGSVQKGGAAPIQGLLDYGEPPVGRGLFLMDSPSPALETLAGVVSGGAQLVLFTTGHGNIAASPLAPTIKISATPLSNGRADGIDMNVAELLEGRASFAQTLPQLARLILDVASGTLTRAEAFGFGRFVVSRFGRSL